MMPKQLQVALDHLTFDHDDDALVTPAVATADKFESAIDALQAELDEMRMQGRRVLSPQGRGKGLEEPSPIL